MVAFTSVWKIKSGHSTLNRIFQTPPIAKIKGRAVYQAKKGLTITTLIFTTIAALLALKPPTAF